MTDEVLYCVSCGARPCSCGRRWYLPERVRREVERLGEKVVHVDRFGCRAYTETTGGDLRVTGGR